MIRIWEGPPGPRSQEQSGARQGRSSPSEAEAAPSGSADNVLVDPRGWRGKIIVKIPNDAATTNSSASASLPEEFVLHQNYPNPFNPATTIEYAVQHSSPVQLKVYDSLGQLVDTLVDAYKSVGEYSAAWDGTDLAGNTVPSGAYFYQLRVGDFVTAKKLIYIK